MYRFLLILMAAVMFLPNFLTGHSEAAAKGKVLVVASSQNKMELADKSIMDVGFFLNEFAVPAQYLTEQGYEIVLATPSGEMPTMDRGSSDKKFFHGDETAHADAENFFNSLQPISLRDAIDGGLDEYAGVFVPGGHAPMTDLMQDENLGTILRYFHQQNKPTAFICHGPVVALAALPNAGAYRAALVNNDVKAAMENAKDWIYAGYNMTVLSDAEEWPGEVKKGTQMPLHVEQALQIAGAKMHVEGINVSHVIRDRELITGQNPASDIALAKEFDKALQEK